MGRGAGAEGEGPRADVAGTAVAVVAVTRADLVVTANAAWGIPGEDELAAIVAAVELVWPRPVAAAPEAEGERWRFSGRWWSKPIPARRDRP